MPSGSGARVVEVHALDISIGQRVAEMACVAKPGTSIVVVDENERGARTYDRTLPGFRRSFRGGRPRVSAPVEHVPGGMLHVAVSDVWAGRFYCLEFVTPERDGEDRPP